MAAVAQGLAAAAAAALGQAVAAGVRSEGGRQGHVEEQIASPPRKRRQCPG